MPRDEPISSSPSLGAPRHRKPPQTTETSPPSSGISSPPNGNKPSNLELVGRPVFFHKLWFFYARHPSLSSSVLSAVHTATTPAALPAAPVACGDLL